MPGIRGSEDLRALELPVDSVFFLDAHDAQQLTGITVLERNVFANRNAVAEFLGTGQGDRYGPEQAARQRHVLTAAAPVRFPHEAVQRRVGAHAKHEQVGDLAGRQRHAFQVYGALCLLCPFRFRHQEGFKGIGAMRRYETDHDYLPVDEFI